MTFTPPLNLGTSMPFSKYFQKQHANFAEVPLSVAQLCVELRGFFLSVCSYFQNREQSITRWSNLVLQTSVSFDPHPLALYFPTLKKLLPHYICVLHFWEMQQDSRSWSLYRNILNWCPSFSGNGADREQQSGDLVKLKYFKLMYT